MGKALIITEKPSVARDITDALGGFKEKNKGEYYESDTFLCTFAVGHILTLLSPEDISPEFRRWRLANMPIIPEKFEVKPVPAQEKRLKVIKKLVERKDVDLLINACDAAREGELIFREIVDYLASEKPISRLWLQSMTKKAIREGFDNLEEGAKFDGLANAAKCRAHADWLIGINATRALTVRLKSRTQRGLSWSAGRVQTPTLSLLVDRELEVLEHEPVPYWRIKARFGGPGHEYEAFWYDKEFKARNADRDHKEDRIFDRKKVDEITKAVQGKAGIAREARKPSPRKPPALFDLTSLQRTANSRFGWTATRTLRAAQRCYEAHKVLTYPRTSSRVLPDNYREEVSRLIGAFAEANPYSPYAKKLQKDGLLNEDKVFNDAGVSDHFAIIPTGEVKDLEGDDQRLFDLVARQFLAAFYPPSVYEDVERISEVGEHSFKSRPPKVLKEAGWEAVFGKKVGETESFPPLVPGENKSSGIGVTNKETEVEDLETKPPSRISEAGLLSLMENAGRQVDDEELATVLKNAEGLGTAATRADIIENLKTREYVNRNLRPTPKGIRLVDILHRIGASRLTSAELTAGLELYLSEVEDGKRSPDDFMKEIAGYSEDVVNAARDFDFESIYENAEPLGPCPRCKQPVYERAWFYGCEESTKRSGKKSCDFLIWKDHNGRYINPAVVRTLLDKGETRALEGFNTAGGNTYSAILALEGGQLVRRPVAGSEQSTADPFEVNPEPLGACPVHPDEKCLVIETPHEYICEQLAEARKKAETGADGFSFPRSLCKREMKRDEVITYIRDKDTGFLSGFISKRGRRFSARLRMEEGGQGFRFEFPERGSKKKDADGKKEAEGDTGKKDATSAGETARAATN